MKKRTDFLVIGSGIAGLSFALKAAKHGKVSVVTKAAIEDSNTRYAQAELLRYSANQTILKTYQ